MVAGLIRFASTCTGFLSRCLSLAFSRDTEDYDEAENDEDDVNATHGSSSLAGLIACLCWQSLAFTREVPIIPDDANFIFET